MWSPIKQNAWPDTLVFITKRIWKLEIMLVWVHWFVSTGYYFDSFGWTNKWLEMVWEIFECWVNYQFGWVVCPDWREVY